MADLLVVLEAVVEEVLISLEEEVVISLEAVVALVLTWDQEEVVALILALKVVVAVIGVQVGFKISEPKEALDQICVRLIISIF